MTMQVLLPHPLAAWEPGPVGYGLPFAIIGLVVAVPCYVLLNRRSKARGEQRVRADSSEILFDVVLGVASMLFGLLGLGGVIGSALQLIDWGSRKFSES